MYRPYAIELSIIKKKKLTYNFTCINEPISNSHVFNTNAGIWQGNTVYMYY